MGIVANASLPGTLRDCYKHGENLQLDVWAQAQLFHLSATAKKLLFKVMKMIKQGRQAETLKYLESLSEDDYEKLVRDREEFAFKFSKKW